MNTYEEIFNKISEDPKYKGNLDWGKPRRGHPEGTVRAHIAELEDNLNRLPVDKGSEAYWKLRILIHVHDTFKAEATPKVPITHPRSHASLARFFLSRYCDDQDLLTMTQFHDEAYALWRKVRYGGDLNEARLAKLLKAVKDWRLFLRFLVIDGSTRGKDRAPLDWSAGQIASRFGLEDEVRKDLELLRN